MPKQRVTKEMVVDAAFEMAKITGLEGITVKAIAEKLGCSVQPIYSYCENMDGLKREVIEQVDCFVREYAAARIDREDLFRSTGQAYLSLAKEEPRLFKLFILHQRENISSLEELYRAEADPCMAKLIGEKLKLSEEKAQELHLHMLIYTIGLGAIFSMTTPGIPAEEIFAQQEQAYQAFFELERQRGGQGKDEEGPSF